ncbi:MAG: molybdopterin-synthase adenylyltransferase MoeB [Candidatus Eisenbacteria bacterium]|nr:molybdopterin-synthase adenylyltransferase MoeB [Candidatus Latescibacterota bacterium]MBD3302080.1 molybdopterin-synthase adenylyltransferase MoeB [Candidatus Eisenbacteria bacterium]
MQNGLLSDQEIKRYGRHLVMPEVGMAGQERLKRSSVLLVGVGGLGSPAALYLAAAGVGRIGLIDPDRVEESNLHRQVLFGTDSVGLPKIEAARDRLVSVNPHVALELHPERLESGNALPLVRGYDVVLDGTDNFPTRYLVNDACVLSGKPNVHGAIFRFEGQLSVFDARRGPCYRCVFPEPPPADLVTSCAEAGVLGVLPGIVGAMQALEAIKLILERGEPLIGRLALLDTLAFSIGEIRIRKDPGCPICGENPTIDRLVDSDPVCSTEGERLPALDVFALRDRLRDEAGLLLLDVREPFEVRIGRIGDPIPIPLGRLEASLADLDRSREIVVYCHTGIRSAHAVRLLREAGFPRVFNLTGGIDAWSARIDPSVPRY